MTEPDSRNPHESALRHDAIAIWRAGVDAVRSDELVRAAVRVRGEELIVCGQPFSIRDVGRIVVVGAGKAGAGMAAGFEDALADHPVLAQVSGWVNVPADCVRPLEKIHLHAARPAGVNEPTAQGVDGARRILELVGSLTAEDLCVVLISGGGSALLPAPKPPVTLADKQAVTRLLMHAGAPIQALNTVRKRLSQIKGGGLARASQAGHTIALIISDIVGDPLDMIASGPTYPDPATDAEALAVLKEYSAAPPDVPQRVLDYLQRAAAAAPLSDRFPETVSNHIIGSNSVALDASRRKAEQLGYGVLSLGSENGGEANQQGRSLAERCRQLRDGAGAAELPVCILSGGEPIVHVAQTDKPRRGGRNQQLVLAGLDALTDAGMDRIVLLSGGTDGEDGPTDAAGACADAELLQRVRQQGLDPKPYLAINDSYGFFEQVDGLLKTGPTHTNVMDLRVALIGNPAP